MRRSLLLVAGLICTSCSSPPGVTTSHQVVALTQSKVSLQIDGPGYFELRDENDQPLFTTKGDFFLDAVGDFRSPDGLWLYPRIVVPAWSSDVFVRGDGTVFAGRMSPDSNVVIGNVVLTVFPSTASLQLVDPDRFRWDGVASKSITTPTQGGVGRIKFLGYSS